MLGALGMPMMLRQCGSLFAAMLLTVACDGGEDCGPSPCGACPAGEMNVDRCEGGSWVCVCEPADVDAGSGDAGSSDAGPFDAGPTVSVCDTSSWPAEMTALEDMTVAEINARRTAGARCGTTGMPAVGALPMSAALREAARCQAVHQSDIDSPTFFGPGDVGPSDRATAAGYSGMYIGGATGASTDAVLASDGVAGVVDSLMSDDTICQTLLDGSATDIGVGFGPTPGARFRYYEVMLGR